VAEPLAYLNGRLLPASQACLPVYDTGIVLAATVTEQERTFHQQPYRLEEHLDRLFDSLKTVRIESPLGKSQIAELSRDLAARNVSLLERGGELGIIQFVTAGSYQGYAGMTTAPVHEGPSVCVHTFPLIFRRWAGKMERGVHLVTPATRQVPPQCYDPRIKGRSRMHFYLAEQEARLLDGEAWALLLDVDGHVAEAAGANFLMMKRGTLHSPLPANILPGVSKAVVMRLADRLGIPFCERDLNVGDVLDADEAFLTSTPYCMLPVSRVNGVPIGSGKPGPAFERLLEAWSKEVGLDIRKQILQGHEEPEAPARIRD
jgi:branched-subunit amino acid aminotransferase/4-amino-4-deoxychorismate lyase